jgi:hypothetical protein
MAPPAGLEPTTPGLGNLCSIQLSYEGIACSFFKKNLFEDHLLTL